MWKGCFWLGSGCFFVSLFLCEGLVSSTDYGNVLIFWRIGKKKKRKGRDHVVLFL